MRTLLLAALAVALAACASAPALAGGSPDGRGASLYRAKCTACHRAYEPESRTGAQWADAVGRMAARAHLREEDRARILAWLQGHARDAGAAP